MAEMEAARSVYISSSRFSRGSRICLLYTSGLHQAQGGLFADALHAGDVVGIEPRQLIEVKSLMIRHFDRELADDAGDYVCLLYTSRCV